MRTIGHRKQHPISFSASAELLAEGMRFNDEIHRLPTGGQPLISKGLHRFKTHEEDANRHEMTCVVEYIYRRGVDSVLPKGGRLPC